MLRKLLFPLAILFLGGMPFFSLVLSGQNLIINGDFAAMRRKFPPFWETSNRQFVFYEETGGPHANGAIIFRATADDKGSSTVRQYNLGLVAGETYQISAWLKTVNFQTGRHGVNVINSGWHIEQGLMRWPPNTDGWQKLEHTFTMPESSNGTYGFVIYAQQFSGEAWLADVKLEAISEKAKAESKVPSINQELAKLRLVAWEPLLNEIPMAKPSLTWHTFGNLTPETVAEYDCVFTLDGREWQRKQLAPKLNTLELAGVTPGNHQLEAAIVKRTDQKKVFVQATTITLLDLPAIDTSLHRRQNNFVTEVLRQPLAAQPAEQSFTFDNPRGGWVYVAVQSPQTAAQLSVRLPGLGEVINNATERHEAFRHLPRGKNEITVSGATAGGQLIVRAIAEIFAYPACHTSQVRQNGLYDWDFLVKNVFGSVTTLNGGSIPAEHLPSFQARGLRWLSSVNTSTHRSVDDLLERLDNNAGLHQPQYAGVTCDEQGFGTAKLSSYTEGIRRYANPNDRLIYTWIVDGPFLGGVHSDAISAALNASRGKGRLLFEAYCPSQATEQKAREYLQSFIVDTMNGFNEHFPNAAEGSGVIFGNFNQMPIICLDSTPEVDYKYYLDMQLNLVAKHGAFANLATTGYWGSYYGDEEMYRWSFALLRHYCVEGKTEMLSQKYGYQYHPGHLKNCDFQDGLDNWQATAAAADSIRPASFTGYGKGSQRRWRSPSRAGDTFCLLVRQDGKPNTVSQTAVGLVPGKVYTLQFVTADHQDMLQKRFNPREHGIKAILGAGAELLPEKCYVFVDKRNSGRKQNDGQARVNLHHLRFRATANTTTVTFTDQEAQPGEELAINFVMMKPYFE